MGPSLDFCWKFLGFFLGLSRHNVKSSYQSLQQMYRWSQTYRTNSSLHVSQWQPVFHFHISPTGLSLRERERAWPVTSWPWLASPGRPASRPGRWARPIGAGPDQLRPIRPGLAWGPACHANQCKPQSSKSKMFGAFFAKQLYCKICSDFSLNASDRKSWLQRFVLIGPSGERPNL